MDGPRLAKARPARRPAADEPVTLTGMDRSGAAVATVMFLVSAVLIVPYIRSQLRTART